MINPISPTTLLIFVGNSEDADDLALAIEQLQPDLIKALYDMKAVQPLIEFTTVQVWRWRKYADFIDGGQHEVIDPVLERADIAVFVFKEAIGKDSWYELQYVRKRRPKIQILNWFPNRPPDEEKMMKIEYVARWLELLEKQKELRADWNKENTDAHTPIEGYRDRDLLKQLAAEHLRRALNTLLQSRFTNPPTPHPPRSTTSSAWAQRIVHIIHPTHFIGRDDHKKSLTSWAAEPSSEIRVVALVAPAGAGKSALIREIYMSLPKPSAFGMFYWDFSVDSRIDEFAQVACDYFHAYEPLRGSATNSTFPFERLQNQFHAAQCPHLIILDGLESVQSDGRGVNGRGQLENQLLRKFLWFLADGSNSPVKALLASRLLLTDLALWKGTSHQSIALAHLDADTGSQILAQWDVLDTEQERQAIAATVHFQAYAIAALGRHFQGRKCSPLSVNFKTLSQEDAATSKYIQSINSLSSQDRSLLARLSVLIRGIPLTVIVQLVDRAEGGQDQSLLAEQAIGRLASLGLVLIQSEQGVDTYVPHPFLRGYFDDTRAIAQVVSDKLRDAIRQRLVTTPADHNISMYEALLSSTITAKNIDSAFQHYWRMFGNYQRLGETLTDPYRGIELIRLFSSDGALGTLERAGASGLPKDARARLITDWGHFARDCGDLSIAREAIRLQFAISSQQDDFLNMSLNRQNLAQLEFLAGRWPLALEAAKEGVHYAQVSKSDDVSGEVSSGAQYTLATAYVGLGDIASAKQLFGNHSIVHSLYTLYLAEFLIFLGERKSALDIIQPSRLHCVNSHLSRSLVIHNCILARCALPDNMALAREHLQRACMTEHRYKNTEIKLRIYHISAIERRFSADHQAVVQEAPEGIKLADDKGFGRWSLDLRLELARAFLSLKEVDKAREIATQTLKDSSVTTSQYKWGIAESYHLLGLVHVQLGQPAEALNFYQKALENQSEIRHPELEITQDEYNRLSSN